MKESQKWQLVEDIFETLESYKGFDSWWEDIEDEDMLVIKQDIVNLIETYVEK